MVSHHSFLSSTSLLPVLWFPLTTLFFAILITSRIKSKALPLHMSAGVLPGLSPVCFSKLSIHPTVLPIPAIKTVSSFLYLPHPVSPFIPFLFSRFPFSTLLPLVFTIFACLTQIKWLPPSGSLPWHFSHLSRLSQVFFSGLHHCPIQSSVITLTALILALLC